MHISPHPLIWCNPEDVETTTVSVIDILKVVSRSILKGLLNLVQTRTYDVAISLTVFNELIETEQEIWSMGKMQRRRRSIRGS